MATTDAARDADVRDPSPVMFAARGLAILLILLGHGLLVARRWFPEPSAEPALAAATRWVYSFHVPVFFVMAGWAAAASSRPAAFAGTVRRRAERLLVPYLAFTLLVSGVKLLVPPDLTTAHVQGSATAFLDQVLLHPRDNPMSVLWFLHVMFSISILGSLLGPRLRGNRRWIAVALLAAGQALPDFDNVLGARDILTYGLPFFAGFAFPAFWARLATAPPAAAWLSIPLVPALQFGLEAHVPRFVLLAATGAAGSISVLCLAHAATLRLRGAIASGLMRLGRLSMRVYLVSYFVEQGLRFAVLAAFGPAFPPALFVVADVLANPWLSLVAGAAVARVPLAARLLFGENGRRRVRLRCDDDLH